MRTMLIVSVAVLLACTLTSSLLAATLGTPTDVAFEATYGGSTQRYAQLLPSDFDPTKQYDVVIALHGSGSDRTQFATGTFDEAQATRDAAANHDMIMICPDYRATTSWMNAAAEADMVQIIHSLKSQYNVGKMIVVGGSMGGTGALTFTALHPNLVDGVCSVNGLANFAGYRSSYSYLQDQIVQSFGGTESEVPAEYAKRSAITSPQSFTMPMSIAAGGADTVVPAASVLSLYDTVRNSNPQNRKTTCFYRPAGGHSTPYADTAVALEYVVRNAKGDDTDLHPITVNTSFEYQTLDDGQTRDGVVNGWTPSGVGAAVVNSSDAQAAAKFDGPTPDGNQVAKLANCAIYQFCGTTVRPGTYHLSLAAACEKDNPNVGTLKTGFLVADNNVASVADLTWGASDSYTTGPGLVPGRWTTIDLDWVVETSSEAIGKCLYINLWADSGNAVCFDNVSLTYSPVPEPAPIVSMATGLFGFSVCCGCNRLLQRLPLRHSTLKIGSHHEM